MHQKQNEGQHPPSPQPSKTQHSPQIQTLHHCIHPQTCSPPLRLLSHHHQTCTSPKHPNHLISTLPIPIFSPPSIQTTFPPSLPTPPSWPGWLQSTPRQRKNPHTLQHKNLSPRHLSVSISAATFSHPASPLRSLNQLVSTTTPMPHLLLVIQFPSSHILHAAHTPLSDVSRTRRSAGYCIDSAEATLDERERICVRDFGGWWIRGGLLRAWWQQLQRVRREEIGVFGLLLPRQVGCGGRGVEGGGGVGDDGGGLLVTKQCLRYLERGWYQKLWYDKRDPSDDLTVGLQPWLCWYSWLVFYPSSTTIRFGDKGKQQPCYTLWMWSHFRYQRSLGIPEERGRPTEAGAHFLGHKISYHRVSHTVRLWQARKCFN